VGGARGELGEVQVVSTPFSIRARALRPTLLGLALACGSTAADAAPSLFVPGVVSTGDSESHATLSPDGRTLYFVKLTPDFAHWTIVVSKRVDGHWSEPVIAPFSGRWDDADLSFSPDGDTIYFVSDSPRRRERRASRRHRSVPHAAHG
jgi:hypothetical protein